MCIIIAYAIAGHHAGLPDGAGGEASLKSRLAKSVHDWNCAPSDISNRTQELKLPFPKTGDESEKAMRASLFIRMIFSSLVDADFLDTERFMDPARAKKRVVRPSLKKLHSCLDGTLQNLTAKVVPTAVNKARHSVLEACSKAAEGIPGFYSLNVPTGGGKTLSSLAFALKHAMHHDLRRVIYTIPFTSIIEQNAQVFRDILGVEAVLEHHSNLEPKNETPQGNARDTRSDRVIDPDP